MYGQQSAIILNEKVITSDRGQIFQSYSTKNERKGYFQLFTNTAIIITHVFFNKFSSTTNVTNGKTIR